MTKKLQLESTQPLITYVYMYTYVRPSVGGIDGLWIYRTPHDKLMYVQCRHVLRPDHDKVKLLIEADKEETELEQIRLLGHRQESLLSTNTESSKIKLMVPPIIENWRDR